ncbi:glycosyltransferase [Paenibacillus thalictri]|nr:glycosyltransferase [Paenibacillus thalictri]
MSFQSDPGPLNSEDEPRRNRFYEELSRYVDITLLIPATSGQEVQYAAFSDTYREIRVPGEAIHWRIAAELRAKAGIDHPELVWALAAHYPSQFQRYFNDLYEQSDIIMYDHPGILGYDLFFGLDDKPRVYWRDGLRTERFRLQGHRPETGNFADYLQKLEETLISKSDLVLSPGDDETGPFAETAVQVITGLLTRQKRHENRTLLVLNDFPVSNPTAGGAERIFQLGKRLARTYRLVLLCFSAGDTLIREQIAPDFVQITIPKTQEHLSEQYVLSTYVPAGTSDIVNSYMAPRNTLFKQLVRMFYASADAVVLSHPYMYWLVQGLEGKPLVYDSLNCESELKRMLLAGHPLHTRLTEYVGALERSVCSKSKLIVTVSDDDRMALLGMSQPNKKSAVIYNGNETAETVKVSEAERKKLKEAFGGAPVALFLGSGHPPNVEALRYINTQLAPRLPHLFFAVIGSACGELQMPTASNVHLFHSLDEATKNAIMRVADVALNPVLKGSGANVKLLDYFGKKIPTVTTPFGARGYPIEDGVHAVVCPVDQFERQISRLIGDPDLRYRLGEHAFALVNGQLSWDAMAGQYGECIQTMLSEKGENGETDS